MPKIKMEDVSTEDMKLVSKKAKREKKDRSLRTMFDEKIAAIRTAGIDSIKKPWMNKKAFKLIADVEELRAWVQEVMAGPCYEVPRTGELLPVVALDTETTGLDTRVVVGRDGKAVVKADISGVCLSSDGDLGIYIPITHEDGNNIDYEACRQILQELFDNCILVFYNAKFDREVMRLLMGIQFREYPYFEDVQVMKYLVDPKADMGDKRGGDQGGLKFLSKTELDMEQIELDTLTKVKADYEDPETGKTTLRVQHAPFSWVPTDIALWYAAGDAICTWLLWRKFFEQARSLKLAHKIDHELVDTITWVERQRFHVDSKRLQRTIDWHQSKLAFLRLELAQLINWDHEEEFNPGSPKQLAKILFEDKGFKPYKTSEKTEMPSTDAESLEELEKLHPDDMFLKKLMEYREYAALHPENLSYDPLDSTARVFLRQCVVAGGRLSATGGDFEKDGGFGLNIQAIKRIEGNKWVTGRRLRSKPGDPKTHEITDLHPSCYKKEEDEYKLAKGIINNHLGQYFGDWYCLVPSCKECNFVSNREEKVDSEEILNIRGLFVAPQGYTFFTTDYSNIEMRVAANISREESFIREFLEGEGDFHTLTAKAAFPEFNDPNTPKDRKKFLRSLAKILNFALLYGGTAYTIFESMKKVQKDITFEQCQEMVSRYWDSVPTFKAWVESKQKVAKDAMICKTATGRIINFKSAMENSKIYEPTEEDKKNYRRFWEIKNSIKELETAKAQGEDISLSALAKLKKASDNMYFDKSSGVRNMQDYRKFLGKIQRVSINIPLQGLAGDFMRMSMNRIRLWAQSDEGVENVLELHGSVHDEIDYSIKNEYVPYIVPRLTRIMKLRDIHEKQKWPVPIECDTEYGVSWDVTEHLTGDGGHEPAGWTAIQGLEEYIPGGASDFDKILKALCNPDKRDKALAYLKANLNPRIEVALSVLAAQDPSQEQKVRNKLIICYQLDEFWNIDQEEDDSKLETLEEYETRMGLSKANRPKLPPGGRLGIIMRDGRHVDYTQHLVTMEHPQTVHEEPAYEPEVEDVQEVPEPEPEPEPQTENEEPKQSEATKLTDKERELGFQILRDDITEEEFDSLYTYMGIGTNKVKLGLKGKTFILPNVFKVIVPNKYLKH